ncbi:hypothetical protein LMG23992_00377 [Cupriavidus laharis]|uniref:Uncharacterized protein n=1 Tax=Cupriavidus laharis TaxID=151654 RepID=A0ABN7XW23_9BURK|nr:hypothetical protein [Cupriavidus laharis]CAG9165233.1 hypothetical protein LMG23992_00377 [Cupriavidus laharis]
MSTHASFRYPFEGHPASIPMVGLFSFSPGAYLKLFGVQIHAAFEDRGLGNQYRRLNRRTEEGPPKEKFVAKALNEILVEIASDEDVPTMFADIKQALDGCAQARERVEQLTFIESLLIGFGLEPDTWQRRHCHQVLMERSGRRAQQLFEAGDTPGAVEYITTHPLLKALVWPEAKEVLRGATSLNALRPLALAMAMDAHLGWLAAWDLDDAENRELPAPQFASLLPSNRRPGRNSTSLLFDELKRRLEVSTITEMMDRGHRVPDVEVGTLYRWSAGKNFPDSGTMSKVMEAHGLLDDRDILYRQFSAAKLINLMGWLSQDLSKKTREHGEPPALWPWPAYPYGHPDFESWAAERYPFWLNFHQERGAALAELAKTAQTDK